MKVERLQVAMHDDPAKGHASPMRAGHRSRTQDPPFDVAFAPAAARRETQGSPSTLHRMSDDEAARFVGENRFAVLSLADGNHAWAVPVFYGTHGGVVHFQARPGAATRYLMRTAEACLTVCRQMDAGEWASANVVGRVERVDRVDEEARLALADVLAPMAWDDAEATEADARIDTFRLGMSRRSGRYSKAPAGTGRGRDPPWGG